MPRTPSQSKLGLRLLPRIFVAGTASLFLLAASLPRLLQPTAHAATTFTVNSTGDGADINPADNLCDAGAGNCTLRAAVEQANATAGADTIGFSVTGTINLTGALPAIDDKLAINGPGQSFLTVRRDTGGDYRIFTIVGEPVDDPLLVSISGLTLANGRTPDGFAHAFGGGGEGGGAVSNGGTLTLTDVTLNGNRTGDGGSIGESTTYGGPGGNGGAVLNHGTMTLNNVTLIGNRTGSGGEAYNGGAGGDGGAVYNIGGHLTMNGCVVRGNTTGGGGRSNREGGRGGDGGGVHSFFGSLMMKDCTVSENLTGAGGGSDGTGGGSIRGGRGGNGAGIYVEDFATLAVLTVSNNVAGRGGNATLGTPGVGGQGGGIYIDHGIGSLTGSTVSGNAGSGGGGIYNTGGQVVATINTTVSGNRLTGPGGAVHSGSLTNCTITANEGPGVTAKAVFNSILPALVRNSIITGNNGGSGPDVSGDLNSQGYNLVGNVGEVSVFTATGDRVGTSAAPLNARLGPLADNGGPTLTHALLTGSPALDAGNNALAVDKDNNPLTTDQRGVGFARRADAADADTTQTVDIGAFEAHPSVEDVSDKTTNRSTPLSFSFNVGDAAHVISSVTAASNNQTLVPDANLSLSGSGSARTLLITPAVGLSGKATITLTVTGSNGRTATDSFVFGVDTTNAAPVFTKGADLTVLEDAGAQTFTNWATGIGPGSPEEAVQSVSFVVTGNTNPGLFSVAPSVSPVGTLTFTPAPEAGGSANITVVLKDNGGTEGGGQDTSAPQTFIVNVTSVNDAPVNTVTGPLTTPRQSQLIFGPNALSVTDVDAGGGLVRLTLSATHGTLTLGGTAGLGFVVGDGTDDATFSFNGTLANVNAALNHLTFMPAQGFTGAASIQLTTDDQGNTGSGGARTDTETIPITVTAVSGGQLMLLSPGTETFETVGTLTFKVGRSFGNADATSVNFATSGGTATGGATCGPGVDYVNANGSFNWADGEANDKTFTVTLCNDALYEEDETLVVSLSNVTGGATLGTSSATMTIRDDDPSGGRIEFSQSVYTAGEGSGRLTVTVTRTGSTGQAAGVDYTTDDHSIPSVAQACANTSGQALDRCDFTRAAGRLLFAAGETVKTFDVLLSDDSYVEGSEVAFVRLSNLDGGALPGQRETATLEITDDVSETSANPVDDSARFVRQHYHDFLNREPDASGLAFWTGEIESCGANAGCREVKRVNVSAAFFLSIEFQETGYLVQRLNKTAYGDASSPNVPGTVPVVRLHEFLSDTRRLGEGVVVGQGAWRQRLDANKRAYFTEFTQRPRFLAEYPLSMGLGDYYNKLIRNAGVSLNGAEQERLTAIVRVGPEPFARVEMLQIIAESEALQQAELRRAFVLMQYYGYLRRNPDDAPEPGLNFGGWNFWLGKLNEFDGNYVRAEMVKAFLSSDEYRKRFGQ